MFYVSVTIHFILLVAVASQHYDYDQPSSLLTDVTDNTVTDLINSSQYFLLDFYMSRQDMMIPMDPTHAACTFTVAEKLKHISQLKFGKIETKKNPVISEEIGIKASPHASKVLFKDGKVIDIINAGMRDLYQPAMLENWIVKRVSGPISDAEVPTLSSEESVVLTLTSTPSPLLAAASLKLTGIMFHHQSGEIEYQGRVLLEGGTYVIRNFLGESSVESVDLEGSEEEVAARIRALTQPIIQHVSTRVFTEIYYNEQWMLGVLAQGAVADHKAIFDIFISALKGLVEMLPDPTELRGVYLLNNKKEKTEGEEFDMEGDRHERLLKHLEIDDDKRGGPTVFLFKSNGMSSGAEPIKATMQTDLTEHNVKTFFFEQVQKKLLEETTAKKRKATKRSETMPPNWRAKKIKHIVRETLEEWVSGSKAAVLILICHGTVSSTLTKQFLSIAKLEKKYAGEVEFGKLNTGLNELDITVPKEGVVRVKRESGGQISAEVVSRTIDSNQLANFISSVLQKKEEL